MDTNVLLDLFGVASPCRGWSDAWLERCRRAGPIVISQIVLAELAAGFPTPELMNAAVNPSSFLREDMPWEAAFLAGKAYLSYGRAGGNRRSPLPDFYIGAHASVRAYRLLTRGSARYRTYFPAIEFSAPDTHLLDDRQ